MANSAVFNFRRNAGSDWISLTEVGREIQACDAGAGNARSPMWLDVSVVRRVSTSKQTGDDVLAHQLSTEVSQQGTVTQCHGGSDASEHKRNCILSETLNQCSSRRSGVMRSDLLAENTSRAAAFNTDCRRCNSGLDTPASVEEQ